MITLALLQIKKLIDTKTDANPSKRSAGGFSRIAVLS
jgi:hypothetical protein